MRRLYTPVPGAACASAVFLVTVVVTAGLAGQQTTTADVSRASADTAPPGTSAAGRTTVGVAVTTKPDRSRSTGSEQSEAVATGQAAADQAAAEPEVAPGPATVGPVAGLSKEQREHAATIIAIGKQLGLPRRGWVVALATAMQESKFRMYANSTVPESFDYPHTHVGSDHDSVGLFQQRPNWGSTAERMNAPVSARLFYETLREVPGWRHLPVTVAAQAVQRSAFPGAYAQWKGLAEELVANFRATPEPAEDESVAAAPAAEQPDPHDGAEPPVQPDRAPVPGSDQLAETVGDAVDEAVANSGSALDRLLVLRN